MSKFDKWIDRRSTPELLIMLGLEIIVIVFFIRLTVSMFKSIDTFFDKSNGIEQEEIIKERYKLGL